MISYNTARCSSACRAADRSRVRPVLGVALRARQHLRRRRHGAGSDSSIGWSTVVGGLPMPQHRLRRRRGSGQARSTACCPTRCAPASRRREATFVNLDIADASSASSRDLAPYNCSLDAPDADRDGGRAVTADHCAADTATAAGRRRMAAGPRHAVCSGASLVRSALGAAAASPPPALACVGDCDGDGDGADQRAHRRRQHRPRHRAARRVPAFDRNRDDEVRVDELVAGVNNATGGCPIDAHADADRDAAPRRRRDALRGAARRRRQLRSRASRSASCCRATASSTATARRRTPNEGVLPYDLNTALFSDYAAKHRFVWLPPGTSATYRRARQLRRSRSAR